MIKYNNIAICTVLNIENLIKMQISVDIIHVLLEICLHCERKNS